MAANPRLVLLDRDGVLNEDRPDSVRTPDTLVLLPRAAAAVARLNAAGIAVAVCTNQSIVGRGIVDMAELDAIHNRLTAELAAEGARLDAILVAPDAPGCEGKDPWARRKPGAGMLRDALSQFGAAAPETPMIGDALRDLQAAATAGCPRHLVLTGKGRATADAGLPQSLLPVMLHENLWNAVDRLLSER
jgi:D-glycero-D-manno-heptose 1,7-bisphosphate phosphatase